MEQKDLISHTADIVSAHVANNRISISDVPELVRKVHEALAALGQPADDPKQEKLPAVSVRSSVKPDYIVCLECGAKQKTLRRHLFTAHGMTPDQYRADYGLPSSYPLTAPNYSDRRRAMAKASGLGRKPAHGAGAASGAGKRRPSK